MTIAEFLEELKKEKYCGAIFPLIHDRRIMWIKEDRTFCPLTKVAFEKLGKFFWSHEYVLAGRALGLAYEDIKNIMKSADNVLSGPIRGALIEILHPKYISY